MPDAHKNFAFTYVVTPPSPADSGTSLTVTAGTGPLFPAVPFNATVWAAGDRPLTTNAEIVRVTEIVGDTLTITRQQEGSSARSILAGDQFAATITAKSLTDIEADVVTKISGINPTLQGYTQTGAEVIPYTAIAVGSIGTVNVTLPANTFAATYSGSGTLYYSNNSPTAGTRTRLKIETGATARTVVIPQTWSSGRAGYITQLSIGASASLAVLLEYTGARWEMYGDPVYGFSLGPQLLDGEYCGIIEPGTAGTSIAFGQLCYLSSSDGRWEIASASSSDGYNKKVGICVSGAAGDGSQTVMLLYGRVRKDSIISGLTVGAPAYMSEAAGYVTPVAPVTAASAVRSVGFGQTTLELFFNPSPDTIVLGS